MPPQHAKITALAATLPAPGADNLVRIQVLPAGRFGTSDGRELPADGWFIDALGAARIIARVDARGTPLVVDYEHQTINAEWNGQPAPAAGWFRALEWVDGAGLYGLIELTPRAADMVRAGEYRYFSPVIEYDAYTGEVLGLLMGALTNNPAIDGMAAAQWVEAASRRLAVLSHHPETNPMDETLMALCAALCLAADTPRDQALAALTAQVGIADQVRKSLALDATAGPEHIAAALTAKNPDPARYVPVAQVDGLRAEVTALSARLAARDAAETEAAIEAALTDGRLPKSLEPWARELGQRDSAALTAYLAGAQPIAALTGGQTRTVKIDDQRTETLSEAEAEVCRRMGITAAAFCAARSNQQEQR